MLTQITPSTPDYPVNPPRPAREPRGTGLTLSRQQMETRRLAASVQLRAGISQSEVARRYGVSRTTTSRWVDSLRHGVSLYRRPTPGRPTRLNAAQIERLKAEYRAHDWKLREFTEVIYLLTDVRYDQDHVGKLVNQWGLKKSREYRKAAVA